jgi:GDPmannose 4,6-dehydratase
MRTEAGIWSSLEQHRLLGNPVSNANPRGPVRLAMPKSALVTGASGQDGSYLCELLLAKGYDVHVLDRVRSNPSMGNLDQSAAKPHLKVHVGDLLERERVSKLVREIQPTEVYNLAAQSFVPTSWELPIYTAEVNAIGPLILLEAIRHHSPESRFYQATSSESFGKTHDKAQDETTYHHPRSPYGVTKSFGMNITRNYRESFGMFACNGILFNHESERRGPQFVTRKVSLAVAGIEAGTQSELLIGNMDAKRDWGHAEDYVRAMWMMMNHKVADDYVVATGETHTIREFIERAFKVVGTDISWSGKGVKEVGKDDSGRVLVRVDARFFRPAEVDFLLGDASKARRELGWKPKVSFPALVKRMVEHDLEAALAAKESRESRAEKATRPAKSKDVKSSTGAKGTRTTKAPAPAARPAVRRRA